MPGRWSSLWDGCRQPPHAAYPQLKRPGPGLAAYLALLRLGVTVPRLLPGARWALTPPFHPYPWIKGGLFSVALPSPHGAQALPGSLPCGARTFLGTPLQPACRDHHALPPPGTNTTGSGRVRARLARQPPQQAAQAVERHALPEGRRLVGGEPETVVFLEHQAPEAGPVAGGQRSRRHGPGVRAVEAARAVQPQDV